MRVFIVTGFLLLALVVAQPAVAAELVDHASGTAVTLPRGWTSSAHHTGVLGTSADGKAKVYLARASQSFGQVPADLKPLIEKHRLSSVVIDESKSMSKEECGPLAAATFARGTATDRGQGGGVRYFAMLVKNMHGGSTIVIGYWAGSAPSVRPIVEGVHVRQPSMEATRQLRDDRTGATAQLPPGWTVYAYRHGLVARPPTGDAIIVLTHAKRDALKTPAGVRDALARQSLTNVQVQPLTPSATTPEGAVQRMTTTGNFKDILSGVAMTARAVIGLPTIAISPEDLEGDKDLGAVVAGGSRGGVIEPAVRTAVDSLRLPTRATAGG